MLTHHQLVYANNDRLERWRRRMLDESAAPVLLLGIVQRNDASQPYGTPILCACEDGPTIAELARMLRLVADLIEAGEMDER